MAGTAECPPYNTHTHTRKDKSLFSAACERWSAFCALQSSVGSQWDQLPHTHEHRRTPDCTIRANTCVHAYEHTRKHTHINAMSEGLIAAWRCAKTSASGYWLFGSSTCTSARGSFQSGEELCQWRCLLVVTLEINLHAHCVQGVICESTFTLLPDFLRIKRRCSCYWWVLVITWFEMLLSLSVKAIGWNKHFLLKEIDVFMQFCWKL